MARPPRVQYEDAFYHITARGNARQKIYLDDFDREMFLDNIGKAFDRFGFIIHAFVLMDNHYHLLIQTPHANLSLIMRYINGLYTQAFNRRHKRVGHIFQGRYKSIIVDRDAHYLELIRYIHLNPWRAKMVNVLDQFRYSSHKAIVDPSWGKKWHAWYDRRLVLKEFGLREGKAIEAYRAFINAGKGKESPFENVIGGYALGDKVFAKWIWERFIDGKEKGEVTGYRKLSSDIEVSKVLQVIKRFYNLSTDELFHSKRGFAGGNDARNLLMFLLNRHGGCTQQEIGKLCGGASRMAVSEAIRRCERALNTNPHLKRDYERIMKALKKSYKRLS